MDYEKMWEDLRAMITRDLNGLADPKLELDSMVALRIAGEKVILNTMNKLEREDNKNDYR